VKEAAALIRGGLRVSGVCQAQQTVAGTLHQRARQTGLGGKESWHPEVTTAAWHAVSRKSLLAGSYLLKEIWAGEKPNLLPFPRSVPSRPPPPPPPGVKQPGRGQNSSHKIRLERSHRPLNLNTKGEDKPKINTRAHKRTPVRCGVRGWGMGGKRRWEGGWAVRKNFMLASLKVCYLFKAVQTFAERWQARNVCESSGSVS